ncbi:MAG: UDP-N-acetylglucosamine 2-epimerase [bacterium]|nr:UDP-N-acetylglucosamine 2-epimerase [bacterium]MDZ4284645.1 UDP-N-acetylglucosamine 2-epimerase [Patescibacteria group bacterium]
MIPTRPLRVALVSERRADYSRFKPILSLLRSDPFFEYRLIVTGVSLLKSRGEDINSIKKDGFDIAATIPMFPERVVRDTGGHMTRGCGRVMIALTDLFEKLEPDLVLTGFDIGANFAAAVVGAHLNIPVAHIQGGEVTGSIDESLRHAMSKFAHIHFPATKSAARRLKRMGEDPRFIFPVGCPSIDALLAAPILSREDTCRIAGVDPQAPYLLVVQHPVTTEMHDAEKQIEITLRAIAKTNVEAVVLYPNNDAGAEAIVKRIRRGARLKRLKSLSPEHYANVLRHAAALVGNSSSGIHESATFRVPTINIGSRQQGRERAGNVIDVPHDASAIEHAIRTALTDEGFRRRVRRVKNIYGDGQSAERIVSILKSLNLASVPIQKQFVD